MHSGHLLIVHTVVTAACAALLLGACSKGSSGDEKAAPSPSQQRTFKSPEDAVKALAEKAPTANVDDIVAFFGPEGRDLLNTADLEAARRNREVFAVAVGERWRLEGDGDRRTVVIGNEDWPFPVPLVRENGSWRFDTAAGKEEILARRIGQNELAAIRISRGYVTAQRMYAKDAHDGKRAGIYARKVRSDDGKHNGLYWPATHGKKRSPIGDLLAAASEPIPGQSSGSERTPFHGYYFKILTAQGASAKGGAKDFLVNGEMSKGFALVGWPAQYGETGIMTFIVNQDGEVYQKDLGSDTAAAERITAYDPDGSWEPAE
jgi:hypothetical protein